MKVRRARILSLAFIVAALAAALAVVISSTGRSSGGGVVLPDPGDDIGNSLDDFPKIAAACAQELGLPLVMVNKTGMEPEGAYTGGSCAVGTDGRLIARADCGGDILYVDFPLDESGRLFGANPSEPAETLRD